MLVSGLDSAYPPTLQQGMQAWNQGYRWWGFYLPKLPNTDPLNGWTNAQVAILRNSGIKPVPICVPAPPAPADPVQTATEYFNLAKQYGLSPKVAVCYNGSHIPVTGPVWLPIPGNPPTAIGPGSAIQYATVNLWGLDVDLNLAADDFPMDTGLVCDLEYNVSYTPEWYATFQNTVANLSGVPKPVKSPRKGNDMFLVYLTDGPHKDLAYLVTENGKVLQVEDDLTSYYGPPMPVSHQQMLNWAAGPQTYS